MYMILEPPCWLVDSMLVYPYDTEIKELRYCVENPLDRNKLFQCCGYNILGELGQYTGYLLIP